MYQILRTTAGRFLKSPRDQFLLAGAIAYLLALEAVGRQVVRGAVGDLFLCSALVVGCAWLAMAHSRRSISWIAVTIRSLRRTIGSLWRHTYRIGWDLRREPAIPRRVPPVLLWLVGGCEALVLGGLIWVLWQPIAARDLIGGVSSVAFAAAQFVLWSALLGIICGLLLAGPALLRDLYVCRRAAVGRGRGRGRRRRIHSSWFFLLFAMMSSAGLCFLPDWAPLLILSGSFLVSAASIWLPPRREFDFIWQPRGRAVVYSMSWRTYVSLMNSISILLCLFVLLLAVGPPALGLGEPELSVSYLLGKVASWVAATGAVVFLWPMAYLELTTKHRDPAAPAPTQVRVQGALTRVERRRIRDVLRQKGWLTRFGAARGSAIDVPVLVGDALPPAGADPEWPRRVSPTGFEDAEFQWSIVRRDQIQRRRVFLRTLRSLLKQARRRRYEKSTGFWIAPQYWFVLGLTRDTAERGRDEQETTLLEVIPPLYHHVFPRAARAHFHDVCRGVGIDLIFLEDGVQWSGLRRVLRMMFEHYDVHGGSRRIEELHFTGVPRVRVVIHAFELGAEWERGQYPEPDFEDLARARILHVFRDRGEEEVPRETPLDRDHLPSPAPAGTLA